MDEGNRTWMTARDAAVAIGEDLQSGDRDFALRMPARAVADLRSLTDEGDRARFLAPPPSTGDERWDTLLAAAISRECRLLGLVGPAWTDVAPLDSWWFPVAGSSTHVG